MYRHIDGFEEPFSPLPAMAMAEIMAAELPEELLAAYRRYATARQAVYNSRRSAPMSGQLEYLLATDEVFSLQKKHGIRFIE